MPSLIRVPRNPRALPDIPEVMVVLMQLSQDPEVVRLFTDRPVVTRTCGHCGGCGKTQAAYALTPGEPLPDAPPDAICAGVVGSCSIFEAFGEAAEIAGRSGRAVAFFFIDQVIVVHPGDDPECRARMWWIGRYGEKPEQTWERR